MNLIPIPFKGMGIGLNDQKGLFMSLESFLQDAQDQYVSTALWAEGLDDCHIGDDVDPDTLQEMHNDVREFLTDNWEIICQLNLSAEDVAHNFWLSRNGHGTGFWDRGWGDEGDSLHTAAKVYAEYSLMVGCDDKIYGV